MEDTHTSRSGRRGSGSSGISILLLLLLLVNTIALGYVVYRTYQAENKQEEFTNQVSRLENEIDKLAKGDSTTNVAANNTTTSSATATPQQTAEASTAPAETQNSSATENQGQSPQESGDPNNGQQQADGTQPSQELPSTYTVQAGDSLSLIAENHGITLEELMQKNGLVDSTVLIGAELTIR